MKLRVTVLNEPELVAKILYEALEAAELFDCGITIRYDHRARRDGPVFNFVPVGRGPVSELEIVISENDAGQVLGAVHALMSRRREREDFHRLN